MSWLSQLLARASHRPGSTRPIALVRMALVASAWSEWGYVRLLYKSGEPEQIAVSIAFYLGTAALFVGFFTRTAAVVSGAAAMAMVYGFGMVGGDDVYWHHHSKVLAHSLLLLAFTPCGNSLSIDRYLVTTRAERQGVAPPSADGDLWATYLMCLQEGVIWLWGGVAKLEWPFLSGGRMMQILFGYYTDLDAWAGVLQPLMVAVALGTVVLEFALPTLMWFRRFRRYLWPFAVLLHVSFYVLLPVGTFSATMWALLITWFDPDEVESVWKRMENPPRPSA